MCESSALNSGLSTLGSMPDSDCRKPEHCHKKLISRMMEDTFIDMQRACLSLRAVSSAGHSRPWGSEKAANRKFYQVTLGNRDF